VSSPNLDDYFELFRLYGGDLSDAYLAPQDERYRLLFDQLCRLLAKQSLFNLEIPHPFRVTAQRYLAGDEATRREMGRAENRNFMLSDLYDFVELQQRLKSRGETHSS
jgi:hypothetical protein